MKTREDGFQARVVKALALRAGHRCSHPDCRASTTGPSSESTDSTSNVGVAAHITAASAGGPRFDANLTHEERRSADNGIWLCQNHAKAVDDDVASFSVNVLRQWKQLAEERASAEIGVPQGEAPIEISMSANLHRSEDGGLNVIGRTNLPAGTKLMVGLHHVADLRLLGQTKTSVVRGGFLAGSFTDGEEPHPHARYRVEVCSYFNGAWDHPENVMPFVGAGGSRIAGSCVVPDHDDIPDTEQHIEATFDLVAPPIDGDSQDPDLKAEEAIRVVKSAVLTVDERVSSEPIGLVVDRFMDAVGLKPRGEWNAELTPDGSVLVKYPFWNGDEPAEAWWNIVVETGDVRYANIHGKRMSWSPAD